MQYGKYGKNGPEISRLGFGVMRLPLRKKGDYGRVNFSRSTAVMRQAMEAGVNVFDSHHNYHHGVSEVAIGRALKGWRGQRIYLQTKTPFYSRKPLAHFKRLIDEALEKMGVNAIDYLLFHSLRMSDFKKRGRQFFKLTDWAMKKGLVRFRGFSSHDTPENVKAFIDTKEFSCMVLSFNLLDRSMEDTIAYGADKGMGVCIMNPLGGGTLAAKTPQMLRLIRGAKSSPEVALRFVLSTPGVTTALSGMNALEQVEENTSIASRKTYMTRKQHQRMVKRLEDIRLKAHRVCTSCGYCMPCPNGVDIPQNFLLFNRAVYFGLIEASKRYFQSLDHNGHSALSCTKCGACIPKCPNKIPIPDQLAETANLLKA